MMLDENNGGETPGVGDNSSASDETKRGFYREALIAKIGEESAKEEHSRKLGLYRNILKRADKAGVDTDAITTVLKTRFDAIDSPAELVRRKREELKMYELSGLIPGMFIKVSDGYLVQESTFNEQEADQILIAYDAGVVAGRKGHSTGDNLYDLGTLGHVKWLEGWKSGQAGIADEMAPAPAAVAATNGAAGNGEKPKGRGRPKGSLGKKAAGAPAGESGETTTVVALSETPKPKRVRKSAAEVFDPAMSGANAGGVSDDPAAIPV